MAATECITVSYGRVRGRAAQYPYFQPAVYRLHTTRDGRKLWRYSHHAGTARRSHRLANLDTAALAQSLGIPVIPGVRHWSRAD